MTITVTPTVEVTNSPPRVRLNVSAGAGEKSATIMRINPDGTQVPVRTADGNPLPISAGSGLLYDVEMPYGLNNSYTSLESPSAVSNAVVVAATQVWLVHVSVPALSMPLTLRPGSLQDETYTTKQSMLYPLGRANPLIVTDGSRKGASSSLTVVTQSSPELAAMRSILADASVLLLNIPASLNVDFPTSYIAISDVQISRLTDVVIDSYRDVKLPFFVVDRPAGGSQAQRTLADLTVYATLGAVNSAYATLAAATTGP